MKNFIGILILLLIIFIIPMALAKWLLEINSNYGGDILLTGIFIGWWSVFIIQNKTFNSWFD